MVFGSETVASGSEMVAFGSEMVAFGSFLNQDQTSRIVLKIVVDGE